jgi:hypothetical protein
MPNKKKPELLPGIKYAPRGDAGGRGGGDYEYYNRANSYNANPEYAQQFGGGGGMPPTLPPLDPPPQEPPQYPEFGPRADGYVQHPAFLQGRAAGATGALPNQQAAIDQWYQPGQPDPNGMNGAQGNFQPPQFGPLSTGYVQSPAFLQGRAAGSTGVVGGQAQDIANWYAQAGAGVGTGQAPTDRPAPDAGATDSSYQSVEDVRAARTADAVQKNQNLTQQAKDTGNSKELARLQAEWDRIAPKAQKYGISAERLVNSYMQPGNDAAETSLDRALGRAIADDTWAGAATVAFGRPPNQLEWDEHWRAMNKGGRDPLEGHPAAIQAIQAKMQEIESENQNEAYGQYQQWLANQ